MLTRSAVAKRLGCSLATVRRLEGKELFPRRDLRGVYRFEIAEVETTARRLREGGLVAALGSWIVSRRSGSLDGVTRAAEVECQPPVLRAEITRLSLENARLKEALADLCVQLSEITEELG